MSSDYKTTHSRQITNLIAAAQEYQERANTAGARVELLEVYRKVNRATGAALAYFLPSRAAIPARVALTKLTGQRVVLNVSNTEALFAELDTLQHRIAQIRDQADRKDDELREYLSRNPPPANLKLTAPELFKTIKPYL